MTEYLRPRFGGFVMVGLAIVFVSAACTSGGPDHTAAPVETSWQYPLQFGDSRAKAHELLGNATRSTDLLEEYPMSGVTLWFDREGRVAKFNFQGSGGSLYAGPKSMTGTYWIPTTRPVVFDLTAAANDVEFARVLGAPVSENEAGTAKDREVRRVWRKGGYVIDALFLGADRVGDQATLVKGTLVWFEIARGL
jgi:hypothetical protein